MGRLARALRKLACENSDKASDRADDACESGEPNSPVRAEFMTSFEFTTDLLSKDCYSRGRQAPTSRVVRLLPVFRYRVVLVVDVWNRKSQVTGLCQKLPSKVGIFIFGMKVDFEPPVRLDFLDLLPIALLLCGSEVTSVGPVEQRPLPREPQAGWHGQSVDNAKEDGHDGTPRGLTWCWPRASTVADEARRLWLVGTNTGLACILLTRALGAFPECASRTR